jgi:hypothetical protein
MRKLLFLFPFILFSCTQPPAPIDWLAVHCSNAGYRSQSDDYNKCMQDRDGWDKHQADLAAAQEKQQKKAAIEAEKQRKLAETAQLNKDKDKCVSYGIKKGTSEFSACLIQIDQARQQQWQQMQMLQAQQEMQMRAMQVQQPTMNDVGNAALMSVGTGQYVAP